MRRATSGGGWPAIAYTVRMARRVGWRHLWRALGTRNACKTCALGMGGQSGGMRDETGHWPEVCKKSLQAIVADMQLGLEPEFFRRYSLADLRSLSPRELEWCGRLTQPLYAGLGDTHYRVISWEEALGRLAEQFRATPPEQCFFYASGRSSNEAGFLLQLLARLYGTNYVNNCSYYCHQASSVGLSRSLGSGTATVTLEDVQGADLFFLLGGNPASNHPRLMRTLMTIRRRGGQVIVVNPVKEVGLVNFRVPSDLRSLLFGSPIASLYVQPHIGGDIAFLTGVAKILLERGTVDQPFIAQATEGFQEFEQKVRATPWHEIERGSGVERRLIEKAADLYAAAHNVVFGWTMGITQHEHGVANVQSIVNLALLRGMVGRPKAGLLPIRGHSNVQGMGSVGVTPQLKQAIFERLEKELGVTLPAVPGLDTQGCVQAAARGNMKAALCLGGNLFGSNPDAQSAARALGNMEMIAYLSTTLNTGHTWGRARHTLVLPVRARDEEPQPTTQESMFNFVRLSSGGPARLEGPKSEVQVLATLARLLFGESSAVDWQALHDHCAVRRLIGKVVPGYEPIGTIDQTHHEFHVGGRIFHVPRFPTATGKARIACHPLPLLRLAESELRLMTVRSEGQFNTVVYEEEDIYRGQERRDVILLNPGDIDRLGLRVDQLVTVRSNTASMHGIRVRAFDIRAGNALMYFPEANVLVPALTDSDSKTPAFKSVPITLEPQGSAGPTKGVHEARPENAEKRRTSLPLMSLLLVCLLGLLATAFGQTGTSGLELFPQHFRLQPREQIHYQVRERSENGQPREPAHYEFATKDPKIVRLIKPAGLFEAVAVGRTELVVRTPTSERSVHIEVAGRAQPPITAVPHSTVREIVGKELLFVGHANLDGFDHTAVAKPGIDRLVQEAKKKGSTVVYWVSQDYPDWYTADRHPDYAIISEGQEHQIRVEAERVVFAGGCFMFCLARNAQMTLHSMLKHHVAPPIHFVFPAQAIWRGPADGRPYPAAMVLLTTSFTRCANDARAYDEVVVPFLNRMISEFPVAGYPPNPPVPPVSELLKDWRIVVRFGDRFERVYRRANSNKMLVVEFQGV